MKEMSSVIFPDASEYEIVDAKAREDIKVLKEINAPYVMPEMFGAIGDGVTDDTNSLLECINYASENKKAVILGGTYLINQELVISNANSNVIRGATPNINSTVATNDNSCFNIIVGENGVIKVTGVTNIFFENIGFKGSNKCIDIQSFHNTINHCHFYGFSSAIEFNSGTNWVGENKIIYNNFHSVNNCIILNAGSDSHIIGNLAHGSCGNFITGGFDSGFIIEANHDYSQLGSEINGYNVTFDGNYIDGFNKLVVLGNSGFNISSNTFLGGVNDGDNVAIKFTHNSVCSGLICGNTVTTPNNNATYDNLYFIDITQPKFFTGVTIDGNNTRCCGTFFKGATDSKIYSTVLDSTFKCEYVLTNSNAELVNSTVKLNGGMVYGYAEVTLNNITNELVGELPNLADYYIHFITMSDGETYVDMSSGRRVKAKGDFSNATSMKVISIGLKGLSTTKLK